ncbi:unnamed protein product, partial [Ectocarpus sp. 12 AP-2014]
TGLRSIRGAEAAGLAGGRFGPHRPSPRQQERSGAGGVGSLCRRGAPPNACRCRRVRALPGDHREGVQAPRSPSVSDVLHGPVHGLPRESGEALRVQPASRGKAAAGSRCPATHFS